MYTQYISSAFLIMVNNATAECDIYILIHIRLFDHSTNHSLLMPLSHEYNATDLNTVLSTIIIIFALSDEGSLQSKQLMQDVWRNVSLYYHYH